MKVEILNRDEESWEEHDYQQKLIINMKTNNSEFHFDVGEQCSEDANLSRDFSDCYLIKDMLKAAYEAGKNGESLEIEEKDVNNI